MKIFKQLELVILVVLSFITHFWGLARVPRVVFDEAHFGLYATKYLSHQYYFDIHPPLGKMILALFAWVAKAKPSFDFMVGAPYGNFPYEALRLAPAFFGFLLVPLIYIFVRVLGFSRKAAFLAGFFVLFDNAILLQSRLILLDIFLVFFIFLALCLFFTIQKFTRYSSRWYIFSVVFGIAAGCAASIKLISLGFFGLLFIWLIFCEHILKESKKYIALQALFLFLVPFFVFEIFLASHLWLLPSSCKANCGAVLTQHNEFLKDKLELLEKKPQGNFLEQLYETNQKILLMNVASVSISDFYYESKWYTWPFLIRPISDTSYAENNKVISLYFLGNPAVWWGSFLGVLGMLYVVVRNFFYKKPDKIPRAFLSKNVQFLLLGYLIFWFSFASIERYTLLYHYLTALIFAIILCSIFLDGILFLLSKQKANIAYGAVLIVVLLGFLYFAPLTYGFPLTNSQFHARMWLPTWNY